MQPAPELGTPGERRFRVLFIPAWYPSADNPTSGTFVREHARAAAIFDDVTVLFVQSLRRRRTRGLFSWSEEMDQGIRTIRLKVPHVRAISYNLAVFAGYFKLARSGYRPEILHAHEYTAGAPSVLLGKVARLPIVVTEHYTGFPRRTLSRRHLLEARLAFSLADAVLPVSRSLQCAIEAYGLKASFQVIPNAVDTDLFHPGQPREPDSHPKRLLFVGLMDSSDKKGLPHLLRALGQLRARREDWHIDLVGDGPARERYERLAAEGGIADKVTFLGLKSKSEVADCMRSSDLFVLPSLWENLPVVLIEAMASGLPIVSTLTGGIPDMIDEATGALVPPGDESALSATLDRMLDSLDKYDRERIARNARQYSHAAVGQSLHAVYKGRVAG